MAIQKGKLLLLSVGTILANTPIDSLTTTSLSYSAETVDVTNKDSANATTLLAGVGITSFTISLSGIVTNTTNQKLLMTNLVAGTLDDYVLKDEDGNTWSAKFQVTSYNREGAHNGAETYSVDMQASGPVTFTPA